MDKTVDLLIIGHGLAGAVLASTARMRGLQVHVFAAPKPGNASAAAAGLVNPMALRRLVPAWRAADLLPLASAFFTGRDAALGMHTWHPLPLAKTFRTAEAKLAWQRAMAKPDAAPFLSGEWPGLAASAISAPFGHGTVPGAAWLDLPAYLQAEERVLAEHGAITQAEVEHADVRCDDAAVEVQGVRARWLVRCLGPFAELPGLVPVKGETINLHIPGLHLDCAVHAGAFLLPLGNHLYRCGATFQWNEVWEGPRPSVAQWLLGQARSITDRPMELVAHNAGVRPASRDRRPLLGRTGPGQAVFNGLGAKGVVQAPWCARHLLDHLFADAPLDPEVEAARFLA
jgi:glycine oxidase